MNVEFTVITDYDRKTARFALDEVKRFARTFRSNTSCIQKWRKRDLYIFNQMISNTASSTTTIMRLGIIIYLIIYNLLNSVRSSWPATASQLSNSQSSHPVSFLTKEEFTSSFNDHL